MELETVLKGKTKYYFNTFINISCTFERYKLLCFNFIYRYCYL